MVTIDDFVLDTQGKGYRRVFSTTLGRLALIDALVLMQEPRVLRQMLDAERRDRRPAFAGAVAEYEARPPYVRAVAGRGRGDRWVKRLNQAVGVACRLVMEANGSTKSSSRGSLRAVSSWFGSSHHYTP